MSTFSETHGNARLPARYRDARSGLLIRIIDVTEAEAPGGLVTTEIGDGLLAAFTWGLVGVTERLRKSWGVSIDELMATATSNVAALPVERNARVVDGATVDITVGHHWVSSLIVDRANKTHTEEGFLAVIPRSDVLVTTPVVGAETVDGLEALIALGEDLHDSAGYGISPFVWWSYQGSLWRVTDRTEDGSTDFLCASNVSAYHLVGAIEHLAHPCAECGRE